jgi:hypothetical protein
MSRDFLKYFRIFSRARKSRKSALFQHGFDGGKPFRGHATVVPLRKRHCGGGNSKKKKRDCRGAFLLPRPSGRWKMRLKPESLEFFFSLSALKDGAIKFLDFFPASKGLAANVKLQYKKRRPFAGSPKRQDGENRQGGNAPYRIIIVFPVNTLLPASTRRR